MPPSSEMTRRGSMADGCPAFGTGCPFAPTATAAPGEIDLRGAAKNCPAFGDGCTFKNARSIEDLQAMLAKM